MRRDQRHQLGPGHHQVHLVQELALARPLGLALESAFAQAQLLHAFTVSHRGSGAGVLQTFPNEDRDRRRAGGMSENALLMAESRAADHAGDEDAAWAWLALAELPAHSLAFLKDQQGADFIRVYGFKTTSADLAFGPDWLNR